MINAKNAKALRQGIRSAFGIKSIPPSRLRFQVTSPDGTSRDDSDFKQTRRWGRVDGKFMPYLVKTTGTLDRMIPRALYLRAKAGLSKDRSIHMNRSVVHGR